VKTVFEIVGFVVAGAADDRTVARRRGRNGRVDAMELDGLDVPLAVLVLGA